MRHTEYAWICAALPAAAAVDTMPLVCGGVLAGQLYNTAMLTCAHLDELGAFMEDTFVPTVRIASTILLAYWLWQEHHVRPNLKLESSPLNFECSTFVVCATELM